MAGLARNEERSKKENCFQARDSNPVLLVPFGHGSAGLPRSRLPPQLRRVSARYATTTPAWVEEWRFIFRYKPSFAVSTTLNIRRAEFMHMPQRNVVSHNRRKVKDLQVHLLNTLERYHTAALKESRTT
ncbi:hypothetical protein G3M48_008775 [Beauveria asiatica]|uniref:Uncharacterized protein n=1 Tax=Beauveria asiatica TaxID=1069075 RepID=A0AAW0RKF8_9HYPO